MHCFCIWGLLQSCSGRGFRHVTLVMANVDGREVAEPERGSDGRSDKRSFVMSTSQVRKLTLKPKVTYSELNVHVVTWNVASAAVSPADVEALFLPQESLQLRDLYNDTDVVAVGLQEAYQGVVEAVGSVVGRDPAVEAFSTFLAGKGFARVSSSRMLGVLTMVFVKRPLLCYISDVVTSTTKTGMAGWLGNKGASSVRFNLAGHTVCFTNCHLVPHPENNERRLDELKDIFASEEFETSRLSLCRPLDHDVLILFGDLNFRLEGYEFSQVVASLRDGERKRLLEQDQLWREQVRSGSQGRQMRAENGISCLHLFMEMPIEFPPSYKYEPGTDLFCDGSKGRPPAWCDRILWRTHERTLPDITAANPRPLLSQQFYGLHYQPRLSDHKAVSAGLQLAVDMTHVAPRVVFHLNEWVSGQQGTISFDVAQTTQVSLWDWIGLYPECFSSVDKDYTYWIYTPAARGRYPEQRSFSRILQPEQVPTEPGRYVLLYQSSRYGCVIGMSPVFRIAALE